MDVAERIVHLRELKGMSQNSLAKAAEISQPALSDIESKKKSPNVVTIEKLCVALGITLAEFFADEEASQITTKAAYLDDGATELPPEAEKEIEQLMEYIRHKYGKKQ